MGTFSWIQEVTHSIGNQKQRDFINRLAPTAQAAYKQYRVLPSVSLAQAILESNWGESMLADQYFNLYGVKAGEQEPNVYLETAEFVNETWITINGRFRVYDNWDQSVEEHARLLFYGVNWNPQLYHAVLEASNYQQAARALQEAGYATDPDYANKLIHMIETYHLDQYDDLSQRQ